VLKEDGKVQGADERQLVEAAQAATDHITPFLQPGPRSPRALDRRDVPAGQRPYGLKRGKVVVGH